jgi:hypothetical protein
MSGAGYRTFQSGEVLTSNNVQTYLMDQAVQVYAGTAERGSAVPTPSTGMVAYSTATGLQVFDGSAWADVGGGTIAIDYLVIAGGGGGGVVRGGGGGAGGYRNSVSGELTGGGGSAETTLQLLRDTNYTVQVGAGAAGVTAGRGLDGNFSQFGNIVSTGGGGGGNEQNAGLVNGLSGGSGGGGSARSGSVGTGGAATTVPVQGFAGGNGSFVGDGAGGGGGGASEVGQNAGTLVSGDGGDGLSSSITGSAVTRGGGGGGNGGTTASGGTGGGGGGGVAGTVNTGGGGGSGTSIAGGSGVVILRYLTASGTITIGAGLTGSTATDGSHKVTTITAGTGNVSWA